MFQRFEASESLLESAPLFVSRPGFEADFGTSESGFSAPRWKRHDAARPPLSSPPQNLRAGSRELCMLAGWAGEDSATPLSFRADRPRRERRTRTGRAGGDSATPLSFQADRPRTGLRARTGRAGEDLATRFSFRAYRPRTGRCTRTGRAGEDQVTPPFLRASRFSDLM